MNRWIIATAALGAMAMPTFGQNLEDAKREADKREETRRAALDAGAAPATPQRSDVVIINDPRTGVTKSYTGDVLFQAMPAPTGVIHAGKKEKVTYLGVITSAPAASVREQLKLPKGVGLVVDSVDEKTAAATAGVKSNDVLEKLNDQLLINTDQLTALVRNMKAGDDVELSIIRLGERQSVKAKLGEKEIEMGGEIMLQTMDRAGAPPTPMAPRRIAVMDRPVMGGAGMTPGAAAMMDGRENVIFTQIDGKQTTQWADDQVRISLERDGDKTTKLTVADANTGKLMFTGTPPAADDPVFKTMPEIADKVKRATEAATARPTMFVGGGFVADGPVGARGKVARWQDDDHVMVLRIIGNKPIYLLALSKKDGRTLYDGPVMTDEQRKSIPAEVSEQFEMLVAHPESAKEFGAAEAKK